VDDQILNDNQNQIPESEPTETPVSEPTVEDTAAPALESATTDDAEISDTEAELSAPETPTGPQRAWYAVHCYSGYENKVKKGLEQRIRSMGMQDHIFRVVVPTEDEIDVREGQRKVIQRRVFPGYILVEMIMTEESWYVVRNTPGVTGFVSSGDKPAPLREEEVNKILKRMETDQPKVRVTYRPGQAVRIVDGPFTDFRGTVEEVNMEKGKVRVLVSMFGRETPLELDLLQVEKV
jgi:transcriptional antiterminator NusG